jgi:hypothetical protein
MASCQPAGGNSRRETQTKRWPTPGFRIALASLASFVIISFGAAVVTAASSADSQAAYAATSSSSVKGPKTVASSWSMSPLPEGEGGAVSSSTQMSPVTEHSSLVAAPR